MRGRPRLEAPQYYDGPAIALTKEDQHYRQDCKLGSTILREACMDLFCRTANRYGVKLASAIARHGCDPQFLTGIVSASDPSKPVLRGQLAQRRLAA